MRLLRLTRYELKKAAGGRFFRIALAALFAVNLFLSCGNWRNFGLGRAMTEDTRRLCTLLDSLTPQEQAEFEASLLKTYRAEDLVSLFFSPPAEMLLTPGYFGEDICDHTALGDYLSLRQLNEQNAARLDAVLRAAKTYGAQALRTGDDHGVRRNLRIIRLYSLPRAGVRYFVSGWDDLLNAGHTMLLALLLILLVCAGIFTKEREQRTWLLLHTSRYGKGKTMAAKLLAAALCAAGITLLLEGGTLLTILFDQGLVGASEPVTAVEELCLFPYRFTVGQYVLLSMGCRVFAAVIMALLLGTVSAVSGSSAVSYAAGGLALGVCLLPVFFPPDMEWLAGPLALARPERYFTSYYTAGLFGFPVLWAAVQAALWCVLTAGCIAAGHKAAHRKRSTI